ncbi:MAG: tryptophan--tRNA ligase [Tenericutes bacterium]|jgi:tryptophanyl-tRNA synthetase|nr:tryptophan--tRNA ligase [Mycoplasmatota bacterium]
MPTFLTGLKPTGDLTLGNYIGAITPLIERQNNDDNKIFLFVADLHALTIYQDPKELRKRIRNFIAMYIACGIDPGKVTIYIQSENEYIPAITWLLECTTQYGEASRMIQFKEKSLQNKNFSVGLLTYPVLMTTDILFCDAHFVPVGIDQKQHVELARIIAHRFNTKYGKTFILPEAIINETGMKITDLKEPTKKMSKSDINPTGVISLFDDMNTIRKKISKAATDSDSKIKYDLKNKPGISNLINIAVFMSGKKIDEIENLFANKSYAEFKNFVADQVVNKLEPIQKKYYQLLNNQELDKILDKGIFETKQIAKTKFELMKQKMGLER